MGVFFLRHVQLPASSAAAAVFAVILLAAAPAAADVDAPQIEQLVRRLDAETAADRDAAEQQLVTLGQDDAEALLTALPPSNPRMPAEVALRLERIRAAVQGVAAKSTVAASRLTLDLKGKTLAEIFDAIEKATGNRLVDYREQFGQPADDVPLSIKADDAPFWPTVDRLLDDANLSPYPYSGGEGLGIVLRPPAELRRTGRAAYAGPFRLEATAVRAQRGLRIPEESRMQVALEASWEPRLAPIALSVDATALEVAADDGRTIPLGTEQAVIDVEIQPGSYASEVTLPLLLPAREATSLTRITGQLTVLVPGKVADFEFEDLADAEKVERQIGGVTVTLDRVRKSQAIWEVYMRVRVAGDETGLESHRSWVYQNTAHLVNAAGETIEDVGMETVRQTADEMGFAYLYEIPDDIAGYKWVYRSPAAIVSVPVEFELTDIPLP